MGPEYLVALSALGGAFFVCASAAAGWFARGKIASVVEELLQSQIDGLEEAVEQMQDDARRQVQAAAGVLDAAVRRAEHDSGADPMGLGLLLPDSDGAAPSPGEAEETGDA